MVREREDREKHHFLKDHEAIGTSKFESIFEHNTLARYEKSIVTRYRFILSFKLS